VVLFAAVATAVFVLAQDTGARMRVLIVEDNKDAADSLAMVLTAWGYDVQVAYDGLEALCVVTGFRPDVVLTDIGLPGLDGFQLTERLLRKPETKNAFFVAVTAYGDPIFRVGLARWGSNATSKSLLI